MEAIGYFQQGTRAERDETLPPIEEQEAAFFRYCTQQGFQPVATFFDTAAPSRRASRGYRQLADYLRQPDRGFTIVVVTQVQELAKEPKDVVRRVLELEDLGARVIATEPTVEDPLEDALNGWRRHRSRDRLSDQALDTLRAKAMRGFGLGKSPYGYHIGPQGRLEIVEPEAAVIRQIYQMYVEEELGLRLIARRLNDSGIATRRGSLWSVVTVRDILRNRVYVGTYVRFGIRVSGSHEAIITPELFRLAQRKRESTGGVRAPGRQTIFLLTGLAYCGYCGARMIGVSRHQSWSRKRDGGNTQAEYRYYRCGSRVNQSVCNYHTRRAKETEQAVLGELAQHVHARPASQEEDAGPSGVELRSSLGNRLRSLDGRFERYLDTASKAAVPLPELRTVLVPILREMQHLETRIEEIDAPTRRRASSKAPQAQQRESAEELLERWTQLSLADQRVLLRDLLQRVVVYDDHLEPVFHS